MINKDELEILKNPDCIDNIISIHDVRDGAMMLCKCEDGNYYEIVVRKAENGVYKNTWSKLI